jgi:hypothetical protein
LVSDAPGRRALAQTDRPAALAEREAGCGEEFSSSETAGSVGVGSGSGSGTCSWWNIPISSSRGFSCNSIYSRFQDDNPAALERSGSRSW